MAKTTDAQKRAHNKYMSKQKRVSVFLPADRAQRLSNHLEKINEGRTYKDSISTNTFINEAIDEKLDHDEDA